MRGIQLICGGLQSFRQDQDVTTLRRGLHILRQELVRSDRLSTLWPMGMQSPDAHGAVCAGIVLKALSDVGLPVRSQITAGMAGAFCAFAINGEGAISKVIDHPDPQVMGAYAVGVEGDRLLLGNLTLGASLFAQARAPSPGLALDPIQALRQVTPHVAPEVSALLYHWFGS